MELSQSELHGVLIFTPTPFRDQRGMFSRTFDAEVVRSAGIDPCSFVQDSLSRSAKGVVRGLHLRSGNGEAKIVRCSAGEIFDVVVDLRPTPPPSVVGPRSNSAATTSHRSISRPVVPTAFNP